MTHTGGIGDDLSRFGTVSPDRSKGAIHRRGHRAFHYDGEFDWTPVPDPAKESPDPATTGSVADD